VNNILPPDDRGVVNSFVTVTCGNETKKTVTIYDNQKPEFSEEMMFRIPITKRKKTFQLNLLKGADSK
jgi:centrosomal protein CEP76